MPLANQHRKRLSVFSDCPSWKLKCVYEILETLIIRLTQDTWLFA